MKHKSFSDMNCSLAQTLEIIGERWSLLILRDAFFGITRFDQFQKDLGIARNILTTRLNHLVASGLMTREKDQDSHIVYLLTEKGLELHPVLLAMTQWGDKHIPHINGVRMDFVERTTGKSIQRLAVKSATGKPLTPREVKAVPGPGATDQAL